MAVAQIARPGIKAVRSRGARLVMSGGPTVALPWWPTELAYGGLAPSWTETERRRQAPALFADFAQLETVRIDCTVSGKDLRTDSIDDVLADLKTLGKLSDVDRLIELHLGEHFTGMWTMADLGITVRQWTDAGESAEADVIFDLKQASTSSVRVGPIRPAGKKAKR